MHAQRTGIALSAFADPGESHANPHLNPIHQNEVKMQKPASDQNQQEEKQQKQRKHKSSSNKNPLLPLKNYMINYSKASEEINEVPEFAIEKFSKYISKGYKPGNELSQSILQIGSMLKLEEMITLGIMKGSRENSVVKKVLHAPTLQLYTVKEEPIHNKDVRKNLKEWIYFWQNNLNQSEQHIKIYNIFWNSPEGCASILMEYAVGGSLQNLLESLGTIPEKSIRQLAIEVLFALRKFHNEFNIPHGALSPSQILFTKEGNIKVSPFRRAELSPSHATRAYASAFCLLPLALVGTKSYALAP